MMNPKEPSSHNHDRFARECAKLDPAEEKAMAEEGMIKSPADWALYRDSIASHRQSAPIIRILSWLQIGGLIVAVSGFLFLFFINQPLRLFQLPDLWPLIVVLTGIGMIVLTTVARAIILFIGRKSSD
jgi:hypothetical protein